MSNGKWLLGFGVATMLIAVLAAGPAIRAWASSAPGPPIQYQSTEPTDAELGVVAVTVRRASSRIAKIWPGFWSASEPFLLYSPAGAQLLISEQAPSSPFQTKGDVAGLESLAFWNAPKDFDGLFSPRQTIDGRSIYGMPALGITLYNRVAFYLHENFHTYQTESWSMAADDEITGLSPVKFVKDPAVLERSAFLAGVRKETDLLEQALATTDRSALMAILRTLSDRTPEADH
jgi:hypothetical protein